MEALGEEGYAGRIAEDAVNANGTVTGEITVESNALIGVGEQAACTGGHHCRHHHQGAASQFCFIHLK